MNKKRDGILGDTEFCGHWAIFSTNFLWKLIKNQLNHLKAGIQNPVDNTMNPNVPNNSPNMIKAYKNTEKLIFSYCDFAAFQFISIPKLFRHSTFFSKILAPHSPKLLRITQIFGKKLKFSLFPQLTFNRILFSDITEERKEGCKNLNISTFYMYFIS